MNNKQNDAKDEQNKEKFTLRIATIYAKQP